MQDELLEKLDNLPIKISNRKIHTNDYRRYSSGYSNHNVGDYSPYTITKRVIESFMDKSFNSAFSYFCKLVPKYQQYIFLEEFEHVPGTRRKPTYFIDEFRIIRRVSYPKKDNPVYFTSWDYATQRVYKRGDKYINRNDFDERTDTIGVEVISGWSKEFKSVKDPEYKRLVAERRKYKKRLQKYEDEEKKKRQLDFLTCKERQEILDRINDEIKLQAHGFDDKIFKGSDYAGQKRKLKKI